MSAPQAPGATTPPTDPSDPGDPIARTNAVLQLAMRMGDVLLSGGMGANDVTVFMLNVIHAYGLEGVHVDITYTSITATAIPAPGLAPVTSIRVVRLGSVDYSRIRRVNRLATRVRKGLPIEEATAALAQIRTGRPPYPPVVAMVAKAGLGPAVTLLFAPDWKVVLLTFLAGLVAASLLRVLGRLRVPQFFQHLGVAFVITMIAAAIAFAGSKGVPFLVGADPTLLVVGGIIMLVAGLMMVGAVQDAIDQYYVTASARMFDVFLRTGGIVAGIGIGLRLAGSLKMPLQISATPIAAGPLHYQAIGTALVAACFALSVYSDLVTVALCTAMALLGWAGFTLLTRAGTGDILAAAIAAIVAAAVTAVIIRWTHVPGFGLVTAAVLPMVPGLTLYYGLLQLVGTTPGTADSTAATASLLHALGVALGLGAGASLGTFVIRPSLRPS